MGNVKHGSKPAAGVILSSKTASKPPPAAERDSLGVNITETAPQDVVESSTASLAAATAAPSAVSLAPVPEDSKLESTLGGEEGERAEKKSEDSEVSEGQKDSTTGTGINEVVD